MSAITDTPRIFVSRWHTRRVAYLKLMLPAVALAIVTLVLAWPNLVHDDKRVRLGQTRATLPDVEALRLINPRYVGMDDQQRPFTVVAASATQQGNQDSEMLLERPKADMTLASGAWVAAEADSGRYDRAGSILDLAGAVHLFHDSGTELRTSKARLLLDQNRAFGDAPVEGQGPTGIVTGEGFDMRDRGAVVLFTGRATAILHRTTETDP